MSGTGAAFRQALLAVTLVTVGRERVLLLISYLQARIEWIPNYRQRRRERQYLGSGHVEKAHDLIVVRWQKRKGMGWSLDTSDSLAALRTLLLNGGWDRYWVRGVVLPLVEPAAA